MLYSIYYYYNVHCSDAHILKSKSIKLYVCSTINISGNGSQAEGKQLFFILNI